MSKPTSGQGFRIFSPSWLSSAHAGSELRRHYGWQPVAVQTTNWQPSVTMRRQEAGAPRTATAKGTDMGIQSFVDKRFLPLVESAVQHGTSNANMLPSLKPGTAG